MIEVSDTSYNQEDHSEAGGLILLGSRTTKIVFFPCIGSQDRGTENQIILCKIVSENNCFFTKIQRNPTQLYYLRCFTNQSCIHIQNVFF